MRRRAGRGAAAALLILGAGGTARAQYGPQYGGAPAPSPGAGRAVLLRLRPRPGDTVRTRFEQSVQILARDAPARTRVASAMTVLGHSVVERVDALGAVVAAVTDSVVLRAHGAPRQATEAARRGMQGRRSRVRVAPDGATTVLALAEDTPGDPRGGGPPPTRFPAALPAGAVTPGAMWSRAMTVPWGAPGRGTRGASTIDVWFRFDSLARGGEVAYLSLRGTVRDAGAGASVTPAAGGEASSVTGAIVVDLARGWVVDSRTTFQLDGAVAGPRGTRRPARVVVTQRLRVL